MAAGRKIQDEREARRFVSAAKRSGSSAGDWARARGVDGRSLRAWALNLARRQTHDVPRRTRERAAARGLVELVPVTAEVSGVGRARYVLDVAGARLEFGDDAAVTTLRRVLEALRP